MVNIKKRFLIHESPEPLGIAPNSGQIHQIILNKTGNFLHYLYLKIKKNIALKLIYFDYYCYT